jgi:hypothetical protein
MRTLTPQELLQVWESGLQRKPVERAVAMLRAWRDTGPAEDPARLTIGSRDARLLALREQAFGSDITGLATCPRCAEPLEMEFQLASLRFPAKELPGTMKVVLGDYDVEFRLPDSLDLLALQETHDSPADLRRLLLDRCIVRAVHRGEPAVTSELPDPVIEEVVRIMGEADPQAEIELSLECVSCRYTWQELFDIESFLWNEIEAWAGRTLREVHQLAAAYGWNEREILELNPVRRSVYLNLIAE